MQLQLNGILNTLPERNIISILVFINLAYFDSNLTLNSLLSSGAIFPELGVIIKPFGKYSFNIL